MASPMLERSCACSIELRSRLSCSASFDTASLVRDIGRPTRNGSRSIFATSIFWRLLLKRPCPTRRCAPRSNGWVDRSLRMTLGLLPLPCSTVCQYSVATSTLMRYRMCDGSAGRTPALEVWMGSDQCPDSSHRARQIFQSNPMTARRLLERVQAESALALALALASMPGTSRCASNAAGPGRSRAGTLAGGTASGTPAAAFGAQRTAWQACFAPGPL